MIEAIQHPSPPLGHDGWYFDLGTKDHHHIGSWLANHKRENRGPYYFLPWDPKNEDVNIRYAIEIKDINSRARARYRLKSCWPLRKLKPEPPRLLKAPQIRPFRWVLSSHHVPEEYAAPDLRHLAPWRIVVRFLLVDLLGQLETLDGTTLSSWRTYRCKTAERRLRRARSAVFSEHEQVGQFSPLVGPWLVVAYVVGDSLEWVSNARPEHLISFGNTTRFRAYRRDFLDTKYDNGWKLAYDLERRRDDAVYTLFNKTVKGCHNPVPVLPEAPICEEIKRIAKVMNDQARTLLYASHERPRACRQPRPEVSAQEHLMSTRCA